MSCFCIGKKDIAKVDEDELNARPKRVAINTNNLKQTPSRNSQSIATDQQNQKRSALSLPDSSSFTTRQSVRGDGLTQLAPSLGSENANVERNFDLDVVAIHGLGGHPRDSWMDKELNIAWLEDFLPKDLPNTRVFTYGYNANVLSSKSIADIDDWAKTLLKDLTLEREQSYGQSPRPLVFICHSMGGLVCKKALVIAHEQQRYKAILDATKAIVFFGTPHRGSAIADFVSNATHLTSVPSTLLDLVFGAGQIRRDLIKILETDGKYLDQLTSSFKERAHNLDTIVTFYETKAIHHYMVVKRGSASIGVANEEALPVEATHTDMCRLTDKRGVPYKTIRALCKRFSDANFEYQRLLNSAEQQCLNSLKPEDHQESDNGAAPNTCEWILNEFHAWRSGGAPILWVSGELGHGKTTLMYFLKDRLWILPKENKNGHTTLTVCSFFCDSRSEVLTNLVLLLRKILWELLSKRHDLIHHAVSQFDEFSAWSRERLWRIFQAVLTDPRANNTLILVDGVDECSVSMRNDFLSRLASCYKGLQASSCSNINFILSSRSGVGHHRSEFKDLSTYLRLDEDCSLRRFIHMDIEKYVGAILSEMIFNRNDEGDVALLAKSIADRSGGSFLWAALVMERAQEQFCGDVKDLERILTECPPKLEGIYYQSLQELNLHRPKIRKTFAIVLAAKRLLTLAEFKFALAAEAHHRSLESLQAATEEDSSFLSLIQDRLGVFFKTDATTITFRHESVRDFIFNKLNTLEDQESTKYSSRIGKWLDLSKEKAEGIMAKCCVSFLKLDDFAESRTSFERDIDNWEDAGLATLQLDCEPNSPTPVAFNLDQDSRKLKVPFFEYAASKWGYHYADSAPQDAGILEDDDLMLLTQTAVLENWSSVFRKAYWGHDELPQKLDALLIAAYFGHARDFIKLSSDPEFGSSEERALTWASRMGHIEIVRLSVDLGIPYDTDMLEGQSAFSWAVERGFPDIVTFLLTKDPNLANIQNHDGLSPLSLAVSYEHSRIVKILLGVKNVDVSLLSKNKTAAIHMAITGPLLSNPGKDILQMLLDKPEVDITLRDCQGRTILWYAADVGATQAIKLLLGCRRRQQAIDKLLDDPGDTAGESPLFRATFQGHIDVIETLCKTGKKVQRQLESVDKMDGANVFDVAAKREKLGAIDMLGKYYPEGVNSRDSTGRTPISIAMWQNKESVLRILWKYKADVNLPDYEGRTPISFGIERMNHVKYLVQTCGADINLADNDGHTPLWYAKQIAKEYTKEHEKDIVRELVSLGARE